MFLFSAIDRASAAKKNNFVKEMINWLNLRNYFGLHKLL